MYITASSFHWQIFYGGPYAHIDINIKIHKTYEEATEHIINHALKCIDDFNPDKNELHYRYTNYDKNKIIENGGYLLSFVDDDEDEYCNAFSFLITENCDFGFVKSLESYITGPKLYRLNMEDLYSNSDSVSVSESESKLESETEQESELESESERYQILEKYKKWLSENIFFRCDKFINSYFSGDENPEEIYTNIIEGYENNNSRCPIYKYPSEYYLISEDAYDKFNKLGESVTQIEELYILARINENKNMYLDFEDKIDKLKNVFGW